MVLSKLGVEPAGAHLSGGESTPAAGATKKVDQAPEMPIDPAPAEAPGSPEQLEVVAQTPFWIPKGSRYILCFTRMLVASL